MIRWLNPAAFFGFGLLSLPILIHLLRTHRAERVPFPSLRFVQPARTAAVRVRPPADLVLLIVRLAIVTAAVAAAAGPVFVTASRIRGWNDRVARALIVDTSAAMSTQDASGKQPLELGRETAAAEAQSASDSVRIETTSVRDGLVRAAAWLSEAPPARREIVVVSVFSLGAVQESDLGLVPPGVGLRFVRVGGEIDARHLDRRPLLGAPGSPGRAIETELAGQQTRARLAADVEVHSGLSILGVDPKSREVQSLFRTLAAAGAPAPSPDEPLLCVFGADTGGLSIAPLGPGTPRWMLRTLVGLESEGELQRMSISVTAGALPSSDRWTEVAFDRNGAPLARVAASSGQFLMQIASPPESLAAATFVRALLRARVGGASRPEQEILHAPQETLAGWSRTAATVDADAWRHARNSDGRWLWVIALLLLVVEERLRRAVESEPAEVRNAA